MEPMQVAFFLLVEEITQALDAIPWVCCASDNVFVNNSIKKDTKANQVGLIGFLIGGT